MSEELDFLGTLERRAFATYESRLAAQRRLAVRGNLWTVALAVSSIATVALSITSLAYPQTRFPHIDFIATLISLVTFGASMVVSLFNFGGRAAEMRASYRRAQRLSARVELLRKTSDGAPSAARLRYEAKTLQGDYQDLLDESENHTQADFARRLIKPVHCQGGRPTEIDNSSMPDQAAPAGEQSPPCRISWVGWLLMGLSGFVTSIPVLLAIAVLITVAFAMAGSFPTGELTP